MNTQLWHVVDVGASPGGVLANVLHVPADLQGGAIRQVLEMAGLPFDPHDANLLPAPDPEGGAQSFEWDDLCERAGVNMASGKTPSTETNPE